MAQIDNVKQSIHDEDVTMELGGRKRVLQFDMNAYGELEKRYGSVEDAMKALEVGGMKDMKIILWAALIHEEAVIDEDTGEAVSYNITPYQVGSWFKTPMLIKEASEKLVKALGFSGPDIENDPALKAQIAVQEAQKAAQLGEEGKNS